MKVAIVIMALALTACDASDLAGPATQSKKTSETIISSDPCVPVDASKYSLGTYMGKPYSGTLSCDFSDSDRLTTVDGLIWHGDTVSRDAYVVSCHWTGDAGAYNGFTAAYLNSSTYNSQLVADQNNGCELYDVSCNHGWVFKLIDNNNFEILFHNREDVPTKMCTE